MWLLLVFITGKQGLRKRFRPVQVEPTGAPRLQTRSELLDGPLRPAWLRSNLGPQGKEARLPASRRYPNPMILDARFQEREFADQVCDPPYSEPWPMRSFLQPAVAYLTR